MEIRFSSRAELELAEVIAESILQFGEARGRKYGLKLQNAIKRLELFPQLGKSDPDHDDGTRLLIVESHIVVYSMVGDEIHISRVVSERQELKSDE